jgi:malonyl CoA-acyl carrier protein transacylase/aryl carrier-like protein
VPPTLVDEPNPELPLDQYPLKIVAEPTAWAARAGHVRRAAVSSFGLSGTNAHLILEEPPARRPREVVRGDGPYVWLVSGRTERQVRANAEALVRVEAEPADVGSSLVTTRAPLERRAALVGADREVMLAELDGLTVRAAGGPGTVFLFGGQGSQRAGMGAQAYAWSAVFRQAFDAAVEALRPHVDGDLRQVVWSDPLAVDRTEWTQPGLFALQVAQAAYWRSLGVVPRAVVGHSVGEFAAGYVAGVWSLEDAARLIAARGRLMGALPGGGAMAAVGAPEDEVVAALVPGAELAAVNAPGACVVSGDEAAVNAVVATLSGRGARTTKLAVSHAFHSHRMDAMLEDWRVVAESVTPAEARLRVVPTCASAHPFGTSAYLLDQVRGAVRFGDAVATTLAQGEHRYLELGSRPVLLPMVARVAPPEATLLASGPAGEGDEAVALLRAAGGLWASGESVQVTTLVPAGARIQLPSMSWEQRRFPPPAVKGAPPPAPTTLDGWVHEARFAAAPTTELPIQGSWRVVGTGALADALREQMPGQGVRLTTDGTPLLVLDESVSETPQGAKDALLAALHAAQGATRFGLVTVGAIDTPSPRLSHRAALGFARAARTERGAGLMVDLDPASGVTERVRDVLTALGVGDGEMTFRSGARRVPSLASSTLPDEPFELRGAWWITGGLGALGLVFARWLVDHGVTDLVLTGRSEPSAEVRAELRELELGGAVVHVVRADVAVRGDVDDVLRGIAARGGTLRGVVHAAGVLDDGLVDGLTDARVLKVATPKVDGAWNLHQATRDLVLDAFVLCSSVATIVGSPGQTSYAGANSFLDGLAEVRRSAGLPAVSIAWGPWSEVGMAARLGVDHLDAMAAAGLVPLRTATGLMAFGRALRGPATVVVSGFPHTVVAAGAASALPSGPSEFQLAVAGAPRDRWPELVEARLRELATAVGAPPDLAADKTMWDQGLDSMKLMDLRNRLLKSGVDIPVVKVIAGPPLAELVALILQTLDTAPAAAASTAVASAATTSPTLPSGEPDELAPLSPVVSHALAAVAGAAASVGIGYVVMQLLGLL